MEHTIGRLIHEAVSKKYGNHDLADVFGVTDSAISLFSCCHSEEAVLEESEPTSNFCTDVTNQTRCLYAIEKYWRFRQPSFGFVVKIHAVTYGVKLENVAMRTEDFVPDFGGTVPWNSEHVSKGLNAIEEKLSEVSGFREKTKLQKGMFLAELFSLIIRVHPFQDGNGRTARMLVLYCLRFWGDDYIVVPKVRNSPEWKDCLDKGVKGDYEQLGKYFEKQIKPKME